MEIFFFNQLNAEALAERENIAFIAPSLGNGYFINTDWEKQGDFLEEMYTALQQYLPLEKAKSANIILGISMGGFGAMRWALANGHFSALISISGYFDPRVPPAAGLNADRRLRTVYKTFHKIIQACLCRDGSLRDDANFELLMENTADFPLMDLYCGREDCLSMPQLEKMEALLKKNKCDAVQHLDAGSHDEQYWRRTLESAVSETLRRLREHNVDSSNN